MKRPVERVELGHDAREYVLMEGKRRVVIKTDSDGSVHGGSEVYITDDVGVPWEWHLKAVLPEAGYVQCNIISPHPSKHTHGVTMFVYATGALSVGPDKYEPRPLTSDHLMAVRFVEG